PYAGSDHTAELVAHAPDGAVSTREKDRVLPAIVTGGARAAMAFVDAYLAWDPQSTATRAEKVGAGWRLSGAKQFVAWAHVADVLLVPARTPDGVTLFLVEPAAAGLALKPLSAIDMGTRWAALTLDGVTV